MPPHGPLPATHPYWLRVGRATGKTAGGPEEWRNGCASGHPAILPHDRSMGGFDLALAIEPFGWNPTI
jgi:hypothetical protein